MRRKKQHSIIKSNELDCDEELTFYELKTRKEEYLEYIKSCEWKALRKQIIEERGNTCYNCEMYIINENIELHHLNYNNPLDSRENIILLCISCHRIMHKSLELFAECSK